MQLFQLAIFLKKNQSYWTFLFCYLDFIDSHFVIQIKIKNPDLVAQITCRLFPNFPGALETFSLEVEIPLKLEDVLLQTTLEKGN